MAASFNSVVLVGNVTRDIELRYIPSGTAVCDIGLAVNEKVKRGDQWEDEVSFFDCTLWGKTAEVASQYLGKGSPVLIAGRLKQETWEKDGEKRYKVKVICERMQMIGSKRDSSEPNHQPSRSAEQPHTSQTPARQNEDEIPF